jgi:hypothetical protein
VSTEPEKIKDAVNSVDFAGIIDRVIATRNASFIPRVQRSTGTDVEGLLKVFNAGGDETAFPWEIDERHGMCVCRPKEDEDNTANFGCICPEYEIVKKYSDIFETITQLRSCHVWQDGPEVRGSIIDIFNVENDEEQCSCSEYENVYVIKCTCQDKEDRYSCQCFTDEKCCIDAIDGRKKSNATSEIESN